MERYSAIVADDEPLLCQQMKFMLGRLWPDLEIVAVANNGELALQQVDELDPDIIFLDIRMPGLTGLEVAKRLARNENSPLLVFVTAYDQYAVEAFEREALDYLLKPVDENRLQRTLERIRQRLTDRDTAPANSLDVLARLMERLRSEEKINKLSWIKALRQDSIFLISPEDVYYFQSEDKYTTVVTKEHEYIIRTPIKDLKSQLDESQFLEIRRGTLVNSKFVDKITRDFVGRMFIHLKGRDVQLQISRSFSANFKQM